MKVILEARKSSNGSPPTDAWLSKLPRNCKQLEERLYRSAKALEEYSDPTTLKSRIKQIVRDIGEPVVEREVEHIIYRPIVSYSTKVEEETATQARSQDILLPKLICTPAEASVVLNQKHMENLFIDFMFFVSHGLAQPPSCKKCAFRNSQITKEETNGDGRDEDISMADANDTECHRLVLWRRDANLTIDTSNMQANLVVLDCHSVGHLLIGEPVGTWIWNNEGKLLIDFDSEKILGSTPFERTHGLAMLLHASMCETDPGTCTENCQKMHTILRHFRNCQSTLHGSGCDMCNCIKPLIQAHSELCTVDMSCPVPGCSHLKAVRGKTNGEGASLITELA